MSNQNPNPTVGIVGAGVAGLAAAITLQDAGLQTIIVEPGSTVGGLAGGFTVGGTSLERYYHHLFPADDVAIRWIRDLGLAERLEWPRTSMGMYQEGRLYPFSTPLDVLRFSPLRPLDRLRLGLRAKKLAATATPQTFRNITAADWLDAHATRGEVEVFWRPMLRAKFGEEWQSISMAWLWARFRARLKGQSTRKGERLGYLRGGFQQLSDAMVERAGARGAQVMLQTRVTAIDASGGVVRKLRTDKGVIDCDAVIWTPALTVLPKVCAELPQELAGVCSSARYHGAVVMVVELKSSVLPYYWVNVADERLPFTVAVEHTRIIPAADYGGRTVVYLGKYAPVGSEIYKAADAEVESTFLQAATKYLSPKFDAAVKTHVFRAPTAQPMATLAWADRRPAYETSLPGLFLCNMAQIYPWDRGINYSLELGENVATALLTKMNHPVRG